MSKPIQILSKKILFDQGFGKQKLLSSLGIKVDNNNKTITNNSYRVCVFFFFNATQEL